MMKFLIVVMLLSFQIVLSMELAQCHQRPLQLPKVDFALLRLDQIKTWIEARPEKYQRSVKKLLSPKMLLIHDIAMQSEDVRKEIIFWMFDGKKENKVAVEEFCKKPIGEALRIYCKVKKGLRNSDGPMGPLYIMPQAKRDYVVKNIINSWYYSYPPIMLATQEKMDAMDDNMKQYCKGKEVRILPYDIEEECAKCMSLLCITPVAVVGGAAIAGATCTKYGVQCICMMPILNVICKLSVCVGVSFGTCFGLSHCYNGLRYSEKKTL